MRSTIFFTLLMLESGAIGWAQAASGGPVCTATPNVPPSIRVEGVAELVNEILLECIGGTKTAVGIAIPTYGVSISVNGFIASPPIDPTNPGGLRDALLVIDEPGTSLNPDKPNICLQLGGCTLKGVATGSPYAGNTNVFPGVLKNVKEVLFPCIPIDGGNHTFRIANLRINAAALLDSPLATVAIRAWTKAPAIQLINGANLPLGNVQRGMTFGAISGNFAVSPTSNQVVGTSAITFRELFPGTMRAREAGNASATTQSTIYSTIPSQTFNGESGYVPDPTRNFGLAAGSTGFFCDLSNIPQGVTVSTIPFASIVAGSATVGSASVTVGGGTTTGPTVSISPDANGNGQFQVKVLYRSSYSTAATMAIPLNIAGRPATSAIGTTIGVRCGAITDPSPYVVPNFDSTNLDGTAPNMVPLGTLTGTTTQPLKATSNSVTFWQPPKTFKMAQPNLVLPPSFDIGVVTGAASFGHLSVSKDPSSTWLTVTLNGTSTPTWATLTVDPTATVSNPSTVVTVTSSDVAASVGTAKVTVNYKTDQTPWFTKWTIGSAASYVSSMIAPGEQFIIFGYNFGLPNIVGPALDANGRAVNVLANTQVLFDDGAVPLDYMVNPNGDAVITGFAPFALDGKTSTQVQIIANGVASPPVTLTVVDAVPAIYTADASGGGQGAILNADGSVNKRDNRASVNDVIVIYGNCGGQTVPAGRDGALAGVGASLPVFKLAAKVFIDGIQATDVLYAGPAPSLVEGIFQINVRIPQNVRSNAEVPVMVQFGDKLSQSGVTVAIK